jgi:poly(hydroxyalkanoate) granule-associated protein
MISRLIKRYKNRTFYDTENRKVVNIDEIARLVNDGLEVKVVDNVTGNDITVQTLAWALSNKGDNDSKNNDNVIIQLLLKRGANVMDVAKKLMLAAIGAVNLSKEKAEEMMDELVKKGEMTQTEKSEALKKMADKFDKSTEKIRDSVEKQVESAMNKFNIIIKIDELAKKVDDLTAEVAELKSKLGSQAGLN